MKIREMLGFQPVWNQLMERKMPAKVAYAIAKNMRRIDSELSLYNETRLKLLGENWPKSADGDKFEIPPEDAGRWAGMLNELLDVEVDIDAHMIDFGSLEEIDLSPREVLALEFMVLQD
jgi:hypothetical protein